MNLEVRKFPHAFRDLDDIAAHIGLDSLQAALRFLDFLEHRFQLIAAFPSIGRFRPDLGAGIHGFAVEDYVIFYRYVSAGIEVERVLHGACDIEALFHDEASGVAGGKWG